MMSYNNSGYDVKYGPPPPEAQMQMAGQMPPPQMVVAQPQMQQQMITINRPAMLATGAPRDWANGLCGCFSNCGICVLSWIVPCYIIGKNAEFLGDSFCAYCLLAFCVSPNLMMFVLRPRIRRRYNIVGSTCGDCLITHFCGICALTQERAEIDDMQAKGDQGERQLDEIQSMQRQ